MATEVSKVFITGAGGYVGNALVRHLLEYGHQVIALDRFRHRHPGLIDLVSNLALTIIPGDCRDRSVLRQALKLRPDFIIPLAAVVGAPACERNREDALSINQDAIYLLNYMREEIPIIYPNTNSGYGTTQPGFVCTEETTLNPISLYGRTKASGEYRLMETGNATTLRFATAFGVSQSMRTDLLVNDFVLRAVRDRHITLFEESFRRNFVHVTDMAGAFLHVMQNWQAMKDQVYNVGLPGALTKRGLCWEIREQLPEFGYTVWGESTALKDPDKRDYDVSVEKMEAAGFRCRIPVSDGIRELIQAYKMLPVDEMRNA